MKSLFGGQWFIQLSLAKSRGVVRRKNRHKESPAHYTEYKSIKHEKKLFSFSIQILQNPSILWIIYMIGTIINHWV